ncbi:adenylate cyclase [Anopheles sinensis]|uniref:Adenylate cyclase n=1 Tax=Anopheles sinensis TaxID=74873 RepID=A0A084W6Y6_ANOSI|nr:adenylate cyclase [Anopheles sinensis]
MSFGEIGHSWKGKAFRGSGVGKPTDRGDFNAPRSWAPRKVNRPDSSIEPAIDDDDDAEDAEDDGGVCKTIFWRGGELKQA